MAPDPGENLNTEDIAPDPQMVKEYMFEAISAMGPRIFRPNQEAHIGHALAREPESPFPLAAFCAGAFIAGAVTGSWWQRRRNM